MRHGRREALGRLLGPFVAEYGAAECVRAVAALTPQEERRGLVDVTLAAFYAAGLGVGRGTHADRTRRRGKEAAAVPPTGGAGT